MAAWWPIKYLQPIPGASLSWPLNALKKNVVCSILQNIFWIFAFNYITVLHFILLGNFYPHLDRLRRSFLNKYIFYLCALIRFLNSKLWMQFCQSNGSSNWIVNWIRCEDCKPNKWTNWALYCSLCALVSLNRQGTLLPNRISGVYRMGSKRMREKAKGYLSGYKRTVHLAKQTYSTVVFGCIIYLLKTSLYLRREKSQLELKSSSK